jgi:uncharacterized protein (DUF58 family)
MGPEDFKEFRKSKIQLFSRTKLRNIFPGEWESLYSGEGIEFSRIKPFEPEDDPRELDLHTLLQSGEEEVIERTVERQMRIYVCSDFSGSMRRFEEMFFSQKPEIKDVAIGLLLFSAWNAYSPVGFFAFHRELKKFFPARSGENYCWEILDWIIQEEYRGSAAPADIQQALAFFIERAPSQSMVFWVSDFEDALFDEDFSELLRPAAKKFDFIPVVVRDPLETTAVLKRSARIVLNDSEGDEGAEMYLTPQKLREFQEMSARHILNLESNFHKAGIEHVVLDTQSIQQCQNVFSGFFQSKKRTNR